MSAVDDRKKVERARDLGRQARVANRKADACPYRSGTMNAERWAWLEGWTAEDVAAKSRARK